MATLLVTIRDLKTLKTSYVKITQRAGEPMFRLHQKILKNHPGHYIVKTTKL